MSTYTKSEVSVRARDRDKELAHAQHAELGRIKLKLDYDFLANTVKGSSLEPAGHFFSPEVRFVFSWR